MFLQRMTDFVLRSPYHAMVAAFVFNVPVIFSVPANSGFYTLFVLITSTVSIAIVGLVTLRRGAWEGFLSLLASSAPYVIGWMLYPESSSDKINILVDVVVQICNVLTWVCAYILFRSASWKITIFALGVICLIGWFIAVGIFPNAEGWWNVQLQASVKSALQAIPSLDVGVITTNENDLTASVAMIAKYATVFVVGFVWLTTLFQVMISRWWQDKVFNPKNGLRI